MSCWCRTEISPRSDGARLSMAGMADPPNSVTYPVPSRILGIPAPICAVFLNCLSDLQRPHPAEPTDWPMLLQPIPLITGLVGQYCSLQRSCLGCFTPPRLNLLDGSSIFRYAYSKSLFKKVAPNAAKTPPRSTAKARDSPRSAWKVNTLKLAGCGSRICQCQMRPQLYEHGTSRDVVRDQCTKSRTSHRKRSLRLILDRAAEERKDTLAGPMANRSPHYQKPSNPVQCGEGVEIRNVIGQVDGSCPHLTTCLRSPPSNTPRPPALQLRDRYFAAAFSRCRSAG